ncbi:hypothetical protein IGI04_039887 [Brassica rapa subsp. trilocularis]|uniref:Uncharacterized protein n=1 Tax=Brassica rapa subsp. trilocularis TaxID=1813537 RepID=A0ABQ7KQA4_BRACM|nr:hypothetical protein IGI04_039887 [Brassica rapa subsp. trilocularis]
MVATKMFFRSGFEVQMTSMKSRRLRGSLPDDFQEVVWTSRKSSRLHGSHLDFMEVFLIDLSVLVFSDLKDFWDDLLVSRLEVVWTSWKSSEKVVWTSWKSSGLLKSRLIKSSGLPGSRVEVKSSESRLDFLKVVWTSWKFSDKVFFHVKWSPSLRLTIQSSVRRLTCKSSRIYEVLWRFFCNQTKSDDLIFSRLRKQISKSIAKITSALTTRLPAHIRLLQEHRILNESDPPIIVSFFDSMNHKKCKIKILKKDNSILGALRASNWLFMVVRVLMIMAIL